MKLLFIVLLTHLTFMVSAQSTMAFKYLNSSYLWLTASAAKEQTIAVALSGYDLNMGVVVSLADESNLLWNKSISDILYTPNSCEIELLNGSKDVMVCVAYSGSEYDFVVIYRLDHQTGNVIWSKKVSVPFPEFMASNYYSPDASIYVDSENKTHISLCMNTDLRQIVVDANGELVISRKLYNSEDIYSKNPGFCISPANDGGYFTTLKLGSNPVIAKFSANGELQWSQLWTIESYSHPKYIRELSNGKIAVTGYGINGVFLAILSSDGIVEKYMNSSIDYGSANSIIELGNERYLLGSSNYDYYVFDLINNYNRYFTTESHIEFKEVNNSVTAFTGTITPDNLYSMQIISNFDPLNPSCIEIYDNQLFTLSDHPTGPENIEQNIPFYMKNDGEMMSFNSSLNDWPTFLTSGCALETEESLIELNIFPNPVTVNGILNITSKKVIAGTTGVIQNMNGQTIHTFAIEQNEVNYPVGNLSDGMYLLKIMTADGEQLGIERIIIH